MTKLRIALILLLSSTLFAGCVKETYENAYYTGGGSGYVTTDNSDVTTGYNRDYQKKPGSAS